MPYRSGGVWEEEYLGLSPSLLDILSCCLPCLLLLPSPLATFRRAKGHKGQSRTARNWGVLNNARVFLALLTLLLGVIFRLLLALSSNFCHTDIVLLGVSFFTFLLGIGNLLSTILCKRVTSVTQTFLWSIIFLYNIPHLIRGIKDLSLPLFLLHLTLQIVTAILVFL